MGWNYLVETFTLLDGEDKLQELLDDSGLGGWELVSMLALPGPGSRFLAIFKKPSTQN
jgi:hypothetical protein